MVSDEIEERSVFREEDVGDLVDELSEGLLSLRDWFISLSFVCTRLGFPVRE